MEPWPGIYSQSLYFPFCKVKYRAVAVRGSFWTHGFAPPGSEPWGTGGLISICLVAFSSSLPSQCCFWPGDPPMCTDQWKSPGKSWRRSWRCVGGNLGPEMRSSPWEALIQQLTFLPSRALHDLMAFKMTTSKTNKSGCGAVLWVYVTCCHYLSISSNMVLNLRVYFIIIKLKTRYIPKIFWKQ